MNGAVPCNNSALVLFVHVCKSHLVRQLQIWHQLCTYQVSYMIIKEEIKMETRVFYYILFIYIDFEEEDV